MLVKVGVMFSSVLNNDAKIIEVTEDDITTLTYPTISIPEIVALNISMKKNMKYYGKITYLD